MLIILPENNTGCISSLHAMLTPVSELENLLQAGLAHDQNQARALGDLGLFCVTCPQIGINVTSDEFVASSDP
jgi:hypothetical protein